jgi:hypothetical protein
VTSDDDMDEGDDMEEDSENKQGGRPDGSGQ